MAGGTPINEIFDEAALNAQKDIVLGILNQVAEKMQQVQGISGGLQGSNNQGDISAGAQKLNQVMQELTATNAKYLKSQQDLTNLQTQLNAALAAGAQGGATQSGKIAALTQNSQLLAQALADVKKQLNDGVQAGKLSADQQAQLSTQVNTLTVLVNQQAKGFSSLTMELRAGERALQTMREAGLQADPAFKKLQLSVAESRREFNNFAKEQKILSSEAPAIAALTVVARGLGGAYAAGAGAAALFGDENGKIQKEFTKLLAVMTLLTGVTELNNALQKAGGISAALSVEWNKALTAVYGEEAIAAATAAEATGAMYAVMSVGLVLVVGALIAGTIALTSKIRDWIDADNVLIERQNKLNDAMKNVVASSKEQQGVLDELTKKKREALEHELANATASGKSAGEILAIKTKLNDFDKQTTDATVKRLGITADSVRKAGEAYYSAASEVSHYQKLLYEDAGKPKDKDLDPDEALIPHQRVKSQQDFTDDDQIKLEAAQKRMEAAKAIFGQQTEAYQKSNEAKQQSDEITAEKGKISAEEHRKMVQQTSLLEADYNMAKNGIVLASDQSSLDDRLTALKSNLEEQKRIIQANKQFAISDPGASSADRTMAIRAAGEAEQKATIENQTAISKLKEDAAKRDLAAYTAIQQSNISVQKNADEQILNNEYSTLAQKLEAHADEMTQERAAAQADYNEKIQAAGKDKAEQLKIETEYQNKLAIISANGAAVVLKIAVDSQKKIRDEKIGDIQSGGTDSEITNLGVLAKGYENLSNSLKKGTITYKEYALAKEKLDNQYAKSNITDQIAANDQQIEYLKNFLTDDQNLKEDNEKKIQALQLKNAEFNKQLKQSDLNDTAKTEEAKLAKKKKSIDMAVEIETKAASLIQNAEDATFENQINNIQDQINANTKAKDQEIENINQSTLSAQDKADQIIIANATAAAHEDQLNQQKKDEQLKQAKFDKDMAIFQIAINTGAGIMKAAPDVPLEIATGILGALELAAVIAKPLPHFALGGEHKGGPLIWGEKGRELAIEPGGRAYMTPGTASVGYAPAGTHIYSADDEVTKMWQGLSFRGITGADIVHDNAQVAAIGQLGNRLVKALDKKRPTHNHIRVDMDRIKWISTNVKN